GGGALVRRRGRASPRHGHGAGLRRRGRAHRPPLRPAGDGALRRPRHHARLAGRLQHEAGDRRSRRGNREGQGDVRVSSELRDLYQEVILDHSKRPRNFRELPAATGRAEGYNPLCGDRATVYGELEGDRVKDVSFKGAGCSISTASASMMTEALKGKTRAEAEALFERFHDLLTGKDSEKKPDTPELGKLAVFSGVREFPVRVKCATLPWHTLKAALQADGSTISTESEGPAAESGGA